MCSGRQYRSTNMQHDLFRSGHDLDFRSNFQNDLLRSTYSSFAVSRQEKYDAGKMNVLPLLSQKLLQKGVFFCKNGVYIVFALWTLNRWSQVKSEANLKKERQKGYQMSLTRATLGGRICPLLDFLNNSKTVADIDTKFGVPYYTSIWHRMTTSGRNRSENFWEIDVFVRSLHANLDQNRLNVKKFAKNRALKEITQKDQYRCTITGSTKWVSRNFKITSFWPLKFRKKTIFLRKPL